MSKTVYDLTQDQILELKSAYYDELQNTDDAETFESADDIPDDVIVEHYDGVMFSDDDFCCGASEQKNLFISGRRSGYAPDQCRETMTVGDLRKALNSAVEWGDLSDDMPIYLCNDSGYTYGEISDWDSFMIGTLFDDAEDFEIRHFI